jgi:hypothetical protein
MSLLSQLSLAGSLAYLAASAFPRFGGEDPLGSAPDEQNWHHEGLTRRAARSAGWAEPAENALAFHADYLDSYLYNPLWWFDLANGGGPDRLPVVMSSQSELIKLHFDDLFEPEQVQASWRRYLSGTVSALLSLGHDRSLPAADRTEMAQNAVGVSLHAVQDFYSHSNWIDHESLNSLTWFETSNRQRAKLPLWTGSYERPEHLGVKPHGNYRFACTVMNNIGSVGRGLMRVVCHAASPYAGSELCRWFKECDEAVPQAPPDVSGLDPPEGILWVGPGINVDSRWQAPIGAAQRGLTVSGDKAFEAAYQLAYRTSCQWLHILDHVMFEADLVDFWDEVKTRGVSRKQYKTPTDPWEDFAKIPYRFLTTGAYPPQPGFDDTSKWHLRLLIQTSDRNQAGTDADVVPIVDGETFPPLDHGIHVAPGPGIRRPSRTLLQSLMGHNDFERGDRAAYMIGPLDSPPATITLRNNAPGAGGVLMAALEGIVEAATDAFEAVEGGFLSLIGYHADFVDDAHVVLTAADLEGLGVGSRLNFSLRCDGDSEGDFSINGNVTPTGSTGQWDLGIAWREYRISFTTLVCNAESDWDRFTNSDEPFVLGLVIPHGGGQPINSWLTEPFNDVDSGETRWISRTFTVKIPQRYGFVSLAVAVYESDDESATDRDALLVAFESSLSERLTDPEDSFLETLGQSIASDWCVSRLEATAFRRGETAELRTFRPLPADQWLKGGEELSWNPVQSRTHRVRVPDVIGCDCDIDCSETRPPPTSK